MGPISLYRLLVSKRRARKDHDSATEVLQAHSETGEPFALFLYDYDYGFTLWAAQNVYGAIRKAIESHMPIIRLVSNTADPIQFWLTRARSRIPGLLTLDENWEVYTERLIETASVIVTHYVYFSPGARRELEMISKCGRRDATIAVVPSNDEDRLKDIPVWRETPDLTIEHRNFDLARLDSQQFHGFAAVIRENQIPWDFADLPGLKSLLSRSVAVQKKV
jgi:hypothetical protein